MFGALDGYFTLVRKFQKLLGYNGETRVKFKLVNAWRHVPVISLSPEELGWYDYGVPIVLSEMVSSDSGGHIDSFQGINLHDDEESQSFLMSTPIYVRILIAMGLAVGSEELFTKLVNKSIKTAYDQANKKGSDVD